MSNLVHCTHTMTEKMPEIEINLRLKKLHKHCPYLKHWLQVTLNVCVVFQFYPVSDPEAAHHGEGDQPALQQRPIWLPAPPRPGESCQLPHWQHELSLLMLQDFPSIITRSGKRTQIPFLIKIVLGNYTLLQLVKGGFTGITLSVCPSVCLLVGQGLSGAFLGHLSMNLTQTLYSFWSSYGIVHL